MARWLRSWFLLAADSIDHTSPYLRSARRRTRREGCCAALLLYLMAVRFGRIIAQHFSMAKACPDGQSEFDFVGTICGIFDCVFAGILVLESSAVEGF